MESIKDFELGSAERFWDALAVGTGREVGTTGAVYLFGYVAEMVLKAAFFRARGFPVTDPVTSHLKLMQAAADQQAPGIFLRPDRHYHNLRLLCEALIWERASQGRPLPALQQSELRTRAAGLGTVWSVDLRYSGAALAESAAAQALNHAEWFLTNYPTLY